MQRSRHGLPRSNVVKYKKSPNPPIQDIQEAPIVEEIVEAPSRVIDNSVISRILEIEALVEQKRMEIYPE